MAFLVAMGGGFALIVSVVALVLAFTGQKAAKIVGTAAIVVAIGVAGLGIIGMILGNMKVAEALSGEGIDPSQKALIEQVGHAEAMQCTKLGMGFGALPLVLAAIALVIAALSRARTPAS